MLILLILTVLFILGIFIAITSYNFEVLGGVLAIFSGVILFCALIMAGCAKMDTPNLHISYKQDKIYIEQVYNNTAITDNERTKVVELIRNDNEIILRHQYWKNNLWIGVFYSDLSDLVPFEQKVPVSNTNATITIN